jgi:superfamily II DNA or RNA helicase
MPSQAPTVDVVTSDSELQISPGSFKVLYVYTIHDGKHDGRLKVGDATYHTDKTLEEIIAESKSDADLFTSDEIRAAAIARINQQTYTADVEYELKAAWLAVRPDLENADRYNGFRDYDVHSILTRSGINKSFARTDKRSGEWFEADLSQVEQAVKTLLKGETSLSIVRNVNITLRSEQDAAVDATLKVFKKGSHDAPKEFLWNAIMRFGKTLTSYALIKKMDPEVQKALIITHRPVVSAGWYEDFQKSFSEDSGWSFGSKIYGEKWDTVKTKEKFVYFASIQDLRGSFGESPIGEDGMLTEAAYKKNEELFGTKFDLCLTDESHEGTKTELAEMMRSSIKAKYWLHLSGTPFNIIEDFDADNIFTWSYIDEQRASERWVYNRRLWDTAHPDAPKYYPGDVNPYGSLPRLEIRAYSVANVFKNHPAVQAGGTKFNFGKFFEVDRSTRIAGNVYKDGFSPFVEPAAVDQLLNMMTESDEHGVVDPATGIAAVDHKNFPFSRDSSKRDFAHTFWVLPTIEAAIALHERLSVHPGFADFFVVNATGDNDGGDALAAVKKAIKENERTITLSVGKLTTGTTIPEWTGVFMLSNMSSPMLYMQTIFRVKSSGFLPDGRMKEVGYVFDFAPDRSLNMVVVAARATLSTVKEDGTKLDYKELKEQEREAVEDVLKYLPVISYSGSRFEKADTDTLMKTLQRIYIAQAVDSGFSHKKLYDFDIHGITPEDLKILEDAKTVIGKSSQDAAIKKMVISKSAMSEKDKKVIEGGKPPRDAPDEDKEQWNEVSKKLDLDRKNARKLVQILTGVSVRLPMLVFATAPEIDVTVDNITEIIDDKSWAEFMPKGFEKSGNGVSWENLKKFYNRDVFEGACNEIQARVQKMDSMEVLERVAAVANLFSSFKNPDKETILTQWSVVNRQYADTLGGLRFVDNSGLWYCKDTRGVSEVCSYSDYLDSKDTVNPLILDPQWTEVDEDLQKFWESAETTVLDVNSKTALYPLLAAVSLFYTQKKWIKDKLESDGLPFNRKINDEAVWKHIVENQIFVNCRVSYSKSIAQRVLAGYGTSEITASVIDVLDIRRKLIDSKVKKDDQAAIWKWLFNPKNLHTATERANEVLTSENLTEIVAKAQAAESDGFVATVSNPPYQLDSDDTLFTTAVYHHFMNVSKNFSRFISMVYPSRWTQSGIGEGIKEFKTEELASKHYIKFFDISASDGLFSNVQIAGGTNHFLWDRDKTKEGIEYHYDEFSDVRNTLSDSDIHIRDPRLTKVVKEKIGAKSALYDQVAPWGYYGTHRGDEIKSMSDDFLKDSENSPSVNCFYITPGKGVTSAKLPSNYTDKPFNDFKVVVSKTAHSISGLAYPRADRIFIAKPGDICTISFMKVGSFKNLDEAENCLRYLKTDFANLLLGIITPAQNMYRKSYIVLPNVDFSTGEILDKPGTFLDFSHPKTLDDQLAAIYNLTQAERNLMKKDLKPWKDKTSVTADM